MPNIFNGPFRVGTTEADDVDYDNTLIAMRIEDGGLELLGEDMTLHLTPDEVRTLLFYGSTVELQGPGGERALMRVDPRRNSFMIALEGTVYHAPRWAISDVARGRLPVAYLLAGRRRPCLTVHPDGLREANAQNRKAVTQEIGTCCSSRGI